MSTLWVVGDSTVSSFEDGYYYPRYGYGTMLDKFLEPQIQVNNIALSGRSSKSYTTEPNYKTLLEGMKNGDFLLVGFGHNDEKTEKERYTNPNGDYKQEGTFANSLYENYIKKAEEAGCRVILCTPIVRRNSDGVWDCVDLHKIPDIDGFEGGDYRQAVIKLGMDLNVPVVDMTDFTRKLYESVGPEKSVKFHAWPSNKSLSVDNTHTNVWGARINAWAIMSCIKNMNIQGLSEYVTNTEENPLDNEEKYLISNPDYVPVVFDSNLSQSSLFQDYGEFKGTVFGDILSDVSKEHFTLETDEHGDMHIAVRHNCGKISAVTDGIAMYYKKVPVGEKFTLSATVRVNEYFSNDQVSFGLMVRDDIYIDSNITDILGDYVAAAPLFLTRTKDAVSSFARRSGKLVCKGCVASAIKPGEEYKVTLTASQDGYGAQFGDGPMITGGFDFKLTAIDPENVYVGMFVSRNADVTFSNIKYTKNV